MRGKYEEIEIMALCVENSVITSQFSCSYNIIKKNVKILILLNIGQVHKHSNLIIMVHIINNTSKNLDKLNRTGGIWSHTQTPVKRLVC